MHTSLANFIETVFYIVYLDIIHLGSTMQNSIVQHSAVHHAAAVGTIITQLAVARDFLRLDRITPLLADHPIANSATDSHSVRDAVRKKICFYLDIID